MAESKTLVSSSSSEQVRLLHLNLPTLTDENIKSQVQQTHSSRYSLLLRQPLLVRISHIIKPATHFVDSILLDKNVIEKGVELENSNLLEFNSALSELMTWKNSLATITDLMGNAADRDKVMFDQIIDQMPIYLLHAVSRSSWDTKALFIMEDLVIKFVELLELLLLGLNKSSINLASSMAALKENPVSIVGTLIEKFQQPLDQLNNLIKITLELIQYICELTLLSDTECSKEDIVSMGAYWAIVSAVAGYIQINLIVDNGEVALELSHLISNLSQILNDLKHHYTICKPQIGRLHGASRPMLPKLNINKSAEGRKERSPKAVVQLSNPSSGFQGLLSKNKRGPYINESVEGRKERSRKAVVQLNNPLSWFQGLLSKNKRGNEKGGSS